jgi:hypothetical protein
MEKSTYKDINIRIIELLKEYGFEKDRTFFLKVINDCIVNVKPRKFSFSESFFVDIDLYYIIDERPLKIDYFHLGTTMSLVLNGEAMFDVEHFDLDQFRSDFEKVYSGYLQKVTLLRFLRESYPEKIGEFKLSFDANPNESEFDAIMKYAKNT